MARLGVVSLADVAREAEVSVSTASRVLNDVPQCIVSQAKRQRIKQAADTLGYRRNRSARQFSTGRTECVGLIIGSSMFTSWAQRATATLSLETVHGITEHLAELNHTVMLTVAPEHDADEILQKQFLAEQRVDGVISMVRTPEGLVAECRRLQVPLVSVQHTRPNTALASVGIDSRPGIEEAAARLAELGHRRAGYIGYRTPPLRPGTGDRQSEWLSSCAERGIEIADELRLAVIDETDAFLQTRDMIQQGRLPTLLICSCDHYAVMAVRAIHGAGLHVPEDVSVVGYDDAQYAQACPVPLATIRIPRREAGRTAAQLVIDLRRDPGRPQSTLSLASTWVERQSAGACRNGHDGR